MEVCGGQTHTIVKYGIDQMLPPEIELVHGPGCPVCVTSLEMIDRAHAIASRPDVIFCSFGDMLRVPGSRGDLLQLKSQGSDVRVVYSPLDAVNLAAANPRSPGRLLRHRLRDDRAAQRHGRLAGASARLTNFSVLVSHVLVPPAMTAILQAPGNRVQGFLGPGHVCTVMGYTEYEPIARRYRVPIVITGFEPIDMLEGVLRTRAAAGGGPRRGGEPVRPGRAAARATRSRSKLIDDVFEVCDRKWRGVGLIPKSGYKLRHEYRDHDAERLFEVDDIETQESTVCISGQMLQGAEEAARLPGVRQGMHAADAAGRHDGFGRRGLRRLLRLWPASGGDAAQAASGT